MVLVVMFTYPRVGLIMSDLFYLKEVLEKSVELNGEKPLTNRWLLNIVKKSMKKRDSEAINLWEYGSDEDIY